MIINSTKSWINWANVRKPDYWVQINDNITIDIREMC